MEDKNKNNPEQSKDGQKGAFEVTPLGSLGLLALGAVGLKAWRQKRAEVMAQQQANNEKKNG